MKIFGILVVYSLDYRERALAEFKKFIRSLGADYELLIVNNGKNIVAGDIVGDNSNHEFSAWNAGIRLINPSENDFIIFANDTFCTRNRWDSIVMRRFKVGLNIAAASQCPSMIGEVSQFSGSYSIFEQTANFWIRTHIFILNGSALSKVGNIGLSSAVLRPVLSAQSNGRFRWGHGVSQNLIERIERWLLPETGDYGWYRAATSDTSSKVRKAKTIVNEKWLSAYMSNHGVKIIDAGPGIIEKSLRELYFLFRRII